ncbi:hypothetical protein ABL78_0038 [Leptomonas seymouri]|uniref:Clu domain-containing protein n=1 Tax=Leptomonas seymouri TaxID=5684 RepID=A0A0N1I9B5_LEPSE|nr:hypothetical protein ABL78_0038 [Leptomonas seymouri]|eukprot:KPI90805.1 hypothetical protein ABL78_0038 [Leptomonas seymouri]
MKQQQNSPKPPTGGVRASPTEAQPRRPPPTNTGSRARRRSQSGGVASPPTAPAAAKVPTTTTPAAQHNRSAVFWGATEDAPLYSGPLGEAVGLVNKGAVLLEASRYRDAFGGWWISTRCVDGSLGWIEFGEGSDVADGTGTASATSPWQRVYHTRATISPSNAAAGSSIGATTSCAADANIPDSRVDVAAAFPQLDVLAIAQLEAKHFLFHDTTFFEYYWHSVFEEHGHRDWNAQYQRAMEAYRVMPQLSMSSSSNSRTPAAAKEELMQLLGEFRESVSDAVMRVCSEAVVPFTQRRLRSFPQHANEVFFVNGILIKRCVDSADGDLGGDELAAKLGNAMYRNNEILAVEAPSHFLYTPLQARCTFGGHSFLCSTIPPYEHKDLLYANACPPSANATADSSAATTANGDSGTANAAPPPSPPFVRSLLRSLSNALHFQGDEVPWEWRVFAGRDRRLYLANTGRLLPPVLPLAKGNGNSVHGPITTLAEESRSDIQGRAERKTDVRLYPTITRSRVRPEVFFTWPTGWRANECCYGEDKEERPRPTEAELKQAALESTSSVVGQWIRTDGITQVAGIVGMHRPLAAVPMPTTVCNTCQSAIDANEVRFVMCSSPSHCCRVCVQCYARLLMDNGEGAAGKVQSADERLSRTCAEAVRCGSGCRKAGCAIMEPSISTILHAHGLNLRYLPYVLHRLPVSTRPAVEHFIHVELIARAAKYVLQQDLCRATTALEARSVCETVLSALLQPTGPVSEHFWRTRLGPVLQSHFNGICEPFQVSVHALRAVAERAQSLTGVWLSDASLASLDVLSASPQPPLLIAGEGGNDGDAPRPFVEIESITPRTWVFPVASFRPVPATAAGHQGKDGFEAPPMWRHLESMLLFWIAFTPENADDLQQPFYLGDTMLRGDD